MSNNSAARHVKKARRKTDTRLEKSQRGAIVLVVGELVGSSVLPVVEDDKQTRQHPSANPGGQITKSTRCWYLGSGSTQQEYESVGGEVSTAVGGKVVGAKVVGASEVGLRDVGAKVVGSRVVGAPVTPMEGFSVVGGSVVGLSVVGDNVVGVNVVRVRVVLRGVRENGAHILTTPPRTPSSVAIPNLFSFTTSVKRRHRIPHVKSRLIT